MTYSLRTKIRSFMQDEFDKVSCATELAENTAWEMEHDEWLDEENHMVWDLAADFF